MDKILSKHYQCFIFLGGKALNNLYYCSILEDAFSAKDLAIRATDYKGKDLWFKQYSW